MFCHSQAVYNYTNREYVTGYVRQLLVIISSSSI